jgi:hypothetical protein
VRTCGGLFLYVEQVTHGDQRKRVDGLVGIAVLTLLGARVYPLAIEENVSELHNCNIGRSECSGRLRSFEGRKMRRVGYLSDVRVESCSPAELADLRR